VKTEADFWACSQCRSINPIKSDRCYSCHTPRAVAAVKPTELSLTDTKPPPIVAVEPFRSSEGRAVLATIAMVLFALGAAVAVWMYWSIVELRAEGKGAAADRLMDERLPFFAIAAVLGGLALLAYGAWISRVVANLPALGAGYSRVSPTMAFIEPIIPGVNLYSLPTRAAEVAGKLDGGTGPIVLIVLAWFLAVGPAAVAAWILRAAYLAESGADQLRTIGLTAVGTFAFEVVAICLGIVVIWRIEGLCRARAGTAKP
jgi:hypothetical protein